MTIRRTSQWVAWALLLGAAPAATAGIIVDDATVEEIADPTFRYTFQMSINDNCIVRAGDFFTFYDVFLPTDMIPPDHPPTQPANWILSTPGVGSTPSGLPAFPDNPAINNLTWTYFGATPIVGPQSLGAFTFTAVQAVYTPTANFTSQCTGNIPPMPPTLIRDVPIRLVPEPMSLATAALGLGIALPLALRRRRAA